MNVKAALPSHPDPRETTPTVSDRVQVFEGRHLPSSLFALAVFAATLFYTIAHWK